MLRPLLPHPPSPPAPQLLKEKDCRPGQERNSGRARLERELGPVGAGSGPSMEHGGGGHRIEGKAGRGGDGSKKERIKDGLVGSFWGPIQILLGTDGGGFGESWSL